MLRGEPAPEQEQALLRRALLAQLGAEPRPRPVVGERPLDEAAEEQRLLLLLHDQPARQVRGPVDRVANRLQLVAEIAVGGRLLVPEQVPQVEEPIDPAQQHLQLEEDLLAPGDLQRPDPALALGQVDRADPLRVAHQLEEEILSEAAPVHPPIVPQLRDPRDFAATLGKIAFTAEPRRARRVFGYSDRAPALDRVPKKAFSALSASPR